MRTSTIVWTIIFILSALFLGYRVFIGNGMGMGYVEKKPVTAVRVDLDEDNDGTVDMRWMDLDQARLRGVPTPPLAADPADDDPDFVRRWEVAIPIDYRVYWLDPNREQKYEISWVRTIGIWVAAFFTLSIFSFLYKDNPFYKIAESVVVGVSAAYWMVLGFWSTIVPNLLANLAPSFTKATFAPGLRDLSLDLWYLIPLILGIMLLMRLSPKGAWISRWPLAFIIGTTAGLRLIAYIHGDFLAQIRNSIHPLIEPVTAPVLDAAGNVTGTDLLLWQSIVGSASNIILVIGVLACLVYFFFSIEHKGVVGRTAKLGIWFLMVTFGAAFGFTVMGRIALLAIRVEFLLYEWLWMVGGPTSAMVGAPGG